MFLKDNLLFCNLIEAVFSSLKLNFVHDDCSLHVASVCEFKVTSMVLKVTPVGN